MRRFSGRVTFWMAPMMAVVLLRRRRPAEGEAARHRVGVGIVVQQDEHPIRVLEVALVLLDARPGHRSVELGR